MHEDERRGGHELESDGLTWAGLLARWTAFAQASVALPRTGEGEKWRAAVPGIIALQAVTFALAEAAGLAAPERALARDRAGVLIERHAGEFARLWPVGAGAAGRESGLPAALAELLADARAAWRSLGEVPVEPEPGRVEPAGDGVRMIGRDGPAGPGGAAPEGR